MHQFLSCTCYIIFIKHLQKHSKTDILKKSSDLVQDTRRTPKTGNLENYENNIFLLFIKKIVKIVSQRYVHTNYINVVPNCNTLSIKFCSIPCNRRRDLLIPKILEEAERQNQVLSDFQKEVIKHYFMSM